MSKYFNGLNYSLANEDTWVEHSLLQDSVKSVFAVCGSGSRVTPLLAKKPDELHVVDLSDVQLRLLRLRIYAAKNLNYREYLFLLGYLKEAPTKMNRRALMVRLNLPNEDQSFWKSMEDVWEKNGFIYLGKWENHFMKLGRVFKRISMSNLYPIFEAKDINQQREFVRKYWKPKFFKHFTKIVLSEWVMNKLLYQGSFAGGKEKTTSEVSTAEHVYEEFCDLFENTWVRGNFFLQMIFLNEVKHVEAFPAECNEGIFESIKRSQTAIHYHQDNLLSVLKEKSHDFYSLSDTFSYLSDADVQGLFRDLPQVKDSQMVIRTFMRKPQFNIEAPWTTDPKLNRKLAKVDCTRMYEFTVLKTSR